MTPHRLINPETLPPAVGFAHAVAAASGRLVFLGGQTAHDAEGRLQGATMVEQFDRAVENVVGALEAAGARPEHVVSVQIFVTSVEEYRAALGEIGSVYRRHFERHYPAMALVEVTALFDPQARVELVAVAVVPEG